MSRICPGAGVASGATISSPVDTMATRDGDALDLGNPKRQQATDILRSEQTYPLARWARRAVHPRPPGRHFLQAPQDERPRSRWHRSAAYSLPSPRHLHCGQHATGIGDCSLARSKRDVRSLSHRHLTDHLQIGRQTLRSAKRIAGAHGIAIHSGASKRRQCSKATMASAVTRPSAWGVGTVSVSTRLDKRSSRYVGHVGSENIKEFGHSACVPQER